MSKQVAWGSIGSDNMLDLKGNVAGHQASALVKWSGEPDFGDDTYGLSIFKRISRGLKKVAKKARPFVNVTAAGAAMVFPPAAPLAAGVAASVNVLAKLEKGTRKQRKIAASIIKGTARAGKRSMRPKAVRERAKARKRAARSSFPRQAHITGTLTFSGAENASGRAFKTLRAVYQARKRARRRGRKVAWIVSRTGYLHKVL